MEDFGEGLARLWADAGERQRACDLLFPVYSWFAQGFDRPYLVESKALLDALPAPREPGTYVLEVGLVDEGLTWFSAVGTPPVRVTVTVARVPPRPDASSALPDPPSVVLTTDRPRYRPGEIVHLTVKGGASERSWPVDVYLILEGPGGAIWFHNGRRLVEAGPCGWVPLATAVSLRKGHGRGVLIDIGTAGMAPGAYRWRLVVTEAGRSRVVADGETGFELRSGAEQGEQPGPVNYDSRPRDRHRRIALMRLALLVTLMRSGERARLAPAGRLIILAPAEPRLFGTLDAACGHHRRYTSRSLGASLPAAGFIVRLRYMNVPGVVGWFMAGRIFRQRTGIRPA